MYGANNQPILNYTNIPPASWKWDICTSKEYYDEFNRAWAEKCKLDPQSWGCTPLHEGIGLVIIYRKN